MARARPSPVRVSPFRIAYSMSLNFDLDCGGPPIAMLRSRLTPSTVLARKQRKPNFAICSSSRSQIRGMKDDTLSGHICLVFEPLREPIWLLNERFEGNTIPSEILKIMVQMLLHGLDYLHTECHIVHTGKHKVYFVWIQVVDLSKKICL